jgi:hypothetical protein
MRNFMMHKILSSEPVFATLEDARRVKTHMHQFPYPYFFRGEYLSSEPHVFNRKAGWAPVYVPELKELPEDPQPCNQFQAPCSTTFTKTCWTHKPQLYQKNQCIVLQP